MRQKKERRKEEAKRNGIECSGKIKRIFRVSSRIPLYHWRESKAICIQFVVYITLFPLVFRQQQPNSTTTDEKGRELFSFYCALFVSYLVLLVYTVFPLFLLQAWNVFFSLRSVRQLVKAIVDCVVCAYVGIRYILFRVF